MNRQLRLIGLVMVCGLAACAKAPTPAGDPNVNPATAQEEEFTNKNVAEPTVVKPSPDAAKQAGVLAAQIDSRAECAPFLEPLVAASRAAPDSPEARVDMTEIMRKAQAAGCTVSRKPAP
jgi:hypothetical protein